ncbi:hypothetical protein MNB_SM-6-331 [hydrothermal vent metagenome]|uniref:Uncharacterized protein n=1 Tax=hydrothermal vent metagenome TaxID=652676 RepID=A0A1W1C2P2_9ZZZZ
MGESAKVVNPNRMEFLANDKNKERQNRVALSKIEADTKIKIAQIDSKNQLTIAKLNADVKKKIAESNAATKIQTTQLELKVREENQRYMIYIAIVVILLLIIALILLYFNSKKNREFQRKLQEEKLKHEQFLREKELEEQRFHKIMELAAAGKLPKSIEKDVVLSISQSKNNIIDNKQ